MTGKRSIVIDVAPDLDLARIRREALAAVRRAEAGEPPCASHLAFSSWEQMRSTLTPTRMALLSHLRRHPVPAWRPSRGPWAGTTGVCTRMWRRWPRSGWSSATRRVCGRSMTRS